MSTLTTPDGSPPSIYTQEKEIRVLALQAACTLLGGNSHAALQARSAANCALELAREFEQYIAEGVISRVDD